MREFQYSETPDELVDKTGWPGVVQGLRLEWASRETRREQATYPLFVACWVPATALILGLDWLDRASRAVGER